MSNPNQPVAPPPRLPENDLRVDFGAPAPGTSNPMPVEVTLAYEERILSSVEAQVAGAQRAFQLFIGVSSVWELSAEERAALAGGANVELTVIEGIGVAMRVVDTPLGRLSSPREASSS